MENSRRLPRRKFTPAERQRLVALYRTSTLTQAQFAREHDLRLYTFQQWLYRKRARPKRPVFKELLLPAASPGASWSAEISLGADITVRLGSVADAKLIAEVVKRLRRSC